MEVKLISYPEETELIAKMAAVICYSKEHKYDDVKRTATLKPNGYLKKIIKDGHTSILEHNVFVFYISGISRVASHQLVRKRIASFSQQSQRYVNAENFDYVIPDEIKNSKFIEEYKKVMAYNHELYQKMVEEGIPKEDARFLLPNATATQLIVSMNAHALIDFFVKRICNRSQWEIRKLAEIMLEEVRKVAPTIFREVGAYCDFYGYCPENHLSCGKNPTIEELKEN
ncbi:MAG: FAD-dependent thymidylate synthase [Candidatus Heimdallarchaeota archaeon]|nr:FAD-dependent thymidylate synthase [Candidatus Heimdallarchaeota archaeon]MCK4954194.1 FAD-dependent thymidylate synthase [Candidatus Heimdallarchaeota archaeon]